MDSKQTSTYKYLVIITVLQPSQVFLGGSKQKLPFGERSGKTENIKVLRDMP